MLIYFTGSDWCGPCILLDKELFHTEKFKELSDEALLLLEVDSPRNQTLLSQDKISENLYLKNKYKVRSFPTLVFVNHKGKKIAEKKGYIINWKSLEKQDLNETINALAMASPFSLEEKQILLESKNLEARKDKISEILSTYSFDDFHNTTIQ